MGKRKTFKVDRRYFAKEIHNLMIREARKEEKKVEELARTRRSTIAEEEGTYDGVSEEGKIPDAYLKTLKEK